MAATGRLQREREINNDKILTMRICSNIILITWTQERCEEYSDVCKQQAIRPCLSSGTSIQLVCKIREVLDKGTFLSDFSTCLSALQGSERYAGEKKVGWIQLCSLLTSATKRSCLLSHLCQIWFRFCIFAFPRHQLGSQDNRMNYAFFFLL